jgi:hypothetical protein
MTGNQTLETINSRHSIRMFSDKPVNENDIKTILQAANKAPSAHNQQSWRFIVIQGEKKQALAKLVSSRAAAFPRPSTALLRMASRSIASAPVVIAVANTGELIEHGTDLFKSVWLGILFLLKDEVLEFLGEPAGEFMVVIPVGYARKSGSSPKKQPLQMIVKNLS